MKIKGVVKKHLGRGKALGFPTANLEAPEGIEEGIWAGLTTIATSRSIPPSLPRRPACGTGRQSGAWGGKLPCLIFVGAAETFGEKEKKLEVYILDFDQDLYGVEIEVELIKKLRNNIKFDSQDELIGQMHEDERTARDFFKTYGRVE